MFDVLADDLSMYAEDSGLPLKLKIVFFSHSFHLVFFIRLGSWLSLLPFVGGFVRFLFEYFIRIFFSSDISLRSKIGPGLMVVHGHDIVIGSSVVIGKKCKIFNGVTLGNKNPDLKYNLHPVIGDGVTLSVGSKILGGVSIGDNAVVGANSVVLCDVPPNAIAVGVPARILPRE